MYLIKDPHDVWSRDETVFLNWIQPVTDFVFSKIHRIDQAPQPNGPPQEAIHPMTNSHLVELTVLAPSGSDVVAEDMKNFAEQLKPLVLMDKVTGRPV